MIVRCHGCGLKRDARGVAAHEPRALPWLSMGRSVQFVLGDTVYEIYE
jgi:hypothetical protein